MRALARAASRAARLPARLDCDRSPPPLAAHRLMSRSLSPPPPHPHLLSPLQEAGIPAKLAPTIGIAVDHRRRNRSLESLQENANRLKAFKANLVGAGAALTLTLTWFDFSWLV